MAVSGGRGLIRCAWKNSAKREIERRRRTFDGVDEPPVLPARIRNRVDKSNVRVLALFGEKHLVRFSAARGKERDTRQAETNLQSAHIDKSSTVEAV